MDTMTSTRTDAPTEARIRAGIAEAGKPREDYGIDGLCEVLYRSLRPLVGWLERRKDWRSSEQVES